MKAQMDSRSIALLFFNLGVRWGRVVNAHSGRFNSWKETRYPLWAPRNCLDSCGKYRPHRDSIFGPSSP